jgi:hypothetical protein
LPSVLLKHLIKIYILSIASFDLGSLVFGLLLSLIGLLGRLLGLIIVIS